MYVFWKVSEFKNQNFLTFQTQELDYKFILSCSDTPVI